MQYSWEDARDGHPCATEEIIERLRRRLVRMAGYYARRCGEDADDLLQEAWLGLLEALPQVDLKIGNPEHFLVQRARWRLLDAVKRARVRRFELLDDEFGDTLADHRPAPALGCVAVDQFAEELKPTQQQVLSYLLAGLTWREAGDALGCTSANIAYHVRQIKRHWETWTGEPVPGATAMAAGD